MLNPFHVADSAAGARQTRRRQGGLGLEGRNFFTPNASGGNILFPWRGRESSEEAVAWTQDSELDTDDGPVRSVSKQACITI